MDYLSAVSELNYMTQIVIMLYEDNNKVFHFFIMCGDVQYSLIRNIWTNNIVNVILKLFWNSLFSLSGNTLSHLLTGPLIRGTLPRGASLQPGCQRCGGGGECSDWLWVQASFCRGSTAGSTMVAPSAVCFVLMESSAHFSFSLHVLAQNGQKQTDPGSLEDLSRDETDRAVPLSEPITIQRRSPLIRNHKTGSMEVELSDFTFLEHPASSCLSPLCCFFRPTIFYHGCAGFFLRFVFVVFPPGSVRIFILQGGQLSALLPLLTSVSRDETKWIR